MASKKGEIRAAMDGGNFSLRDRTQARSNDKVLQQQGYGNPPAQATQQSRVGFSTPRSASFSGGLDGLRQSRLDASPTPGLDAQRQGTIRYGTAQGRMAEQTAATVKSSLSGAFGERAKAKTKRDVIGTASRLREQGIDMVGLSSKGASVPAAKSPSASPDYSGIYTDKPGEDAAATAPAAPLQGSALAQSNIATKGIQGAAADYFARKDTEMLAKQSKGLDTAMAKPQAYQGNSTAKPTRAGVAAPAASGSLSPMKVSLSPGATPEEDRIKRGQQPTMAMGSMPKPATVAQSGGDDYGGAIKLKNGGKELEAAYKGGQKNAPSDNLKASLGLRSLRKPKVAMR